jgi:hypothetical protein
MPPESLHGSLLCPADWIIPIISRAVLLKTKTNHFLVQLQNNSFLLDVILSNQKTVTSYPSPQKEHIPSCRPESKFVTLRVMGIHDDLGMQEVPVKFS